MNTHPNLDPGHRGTHYAGVHIVDRLAAEPFWTRLRRRFLGRPVLFVSLAGSFRGRPVQNWVLIYRWRGRYPVFELLGRGIAFPGDRLAIPPRTHVIEH